MDLTSIQWELALVALAIGVMLTDLLAPQMSRRQLGCWTIAGMTSVFLICLYQSQSSLSSLTEIAPSHPLFSDAFTLWARQFAMGSTLLTLIISTRYLREDQPHYAEYLVLQIIASVGMMFASTSRDFPTLFISLELMTVCFYVLAAFHRKNALSLEAGLKYLIFGALASGIMLYGMALVFGSTGGMQFGEIRESLTHSSPSSILLLGFILILVGIGFKISAVPFHWWTPDVYEGSPTPTTAIFSLTSKAAGFVVMIRILFDTFLPLQYLWLPIVGFAAGASILIGNLGALSQHNLKRLMGYSSISHTGYMLLGIAATSLLGLGAVVYYFLGYLLANGLVFAAMCETAVENPRQDIHGYAGLGQRSGWAAAALTLGLLSLAGIPPLAGFFGKFLLLTSAVEALNNGSARLFETLIVIAIIGATISLYYYLSVIRRIYFSDSEPEPKPLLPVPWITKGTIIILILGLIAVGLFQSHWMDLSRAVVQPLIGN